MLLQEQDLLNFCADRKWTAVKVYKDPKHSRFTLDRPDLQLMLKAAQDGKFQRILVYDQSRFSGNIEHSRKLRRELASFGVDVLGLLDIPRDTLDGQLAGDMRLLVEEFVKRTEAQKSVATKVLRWQNGYWVSPAPFGYSFNKKSHLLEPNSQEAKLVLDIFTLTVERPFGIYNHFPPAIKVVAEQVNKPWSSVKHILRNRAYIGEVIYRKQWKPGIHQPLVPIAIFEAVQKRFWPSD